MKITNIPQPELTIPITYLKGKYNLSKYSVPYFSVVLDMNLVAEKFSLIDEIRGSESLNWSIDELFQRDVSWARINKELTRYLENSKKLQFFNALTIALLPVNAEGFMDQYVNDDRLYDPINDEELDDPIQIGGIQMQDYKSSGGTVGRLRWDVEKIAAVAVDGQHRLAAIKKIKNRVNPESLKRTQVPIIILIPHRDVGFSCPQHPGVDHSIIFSLRQIFIDLNKNVKKVSRSRTILLDDQDIPSVCLRSLIGESLGENNSTKLPLSAVDWVSDRNKFEKGPFVTTTLTLYEIVKSMLDYRYSSSTLVTESSQREIKSWLEKNFFVSDDDQLSELMKTVGECYWNNLPLTFQQKSITYLKNQFKQTWGVEIIKIFSKIKPYEELMSMCNQYNFYSPELFNLYVASEIVGGDEGENKAKRIRETLESSQDQWRYDRNYEAPIKEINSVKDNQWAFKVVFQKALFISYGILFTLVDDYIGCEDIPRKQLSKFTDIWIDAINQLFAAGAGNEKFKLNRDELFWEGIGLTPAVQRIEVTKAASERIAYWLSVWVTMSLMNKIPTYSALRKNAEQNNLFGNCVSFLIKSKNKVVERGMEKIVKARYKNSESDDDTLVRKCIEERYNKLKKIMGS